MWRSVGEACAYRRDSGFALIIVIWGLGLISLIALTIITAGRYRVLASLNVVENAKAEALAEAGVNLLRLELRAAFAGGSVGTLRFASNGEPVLCTMPQGALAALAVDDEGGKADLNTAPPLLMSALLRGFGARPQEADQIAAAIVEFSRPGNGAINDVASRAYVADLRSYGPKRAPFETVFELDQVLGMSPELFRAVLPYVTVHSHATGVDPRVAAPALLAALAGLEPARVRKLADLAQGDRAGEASARDIPSRFLSTSNNRTFLVHAEVRMPGGSSFAQQAIVDLTAGGLQDDLREWRRGQARFVALLAAAARSGAAAPSWPRC
jgi:general secretion pathway protein K